MGARDTYYNLHCILFKLNCILFHLHSYITLTQSLSYKPRYSELFLILWSGDPADKRNRRKDRIELLYLFSLSKLGSQAIICFLLHSAYWSWSRIRPTVIVLCQDPWLLVAGHTLRSVLSPLVLSVGDVDGGRVLSVAWDCAPTHIVVDHSLAWNFQPVEKRNIRTRTRTQEHQNHVP